MNLKLFYSTDIIPNSIRMLYLHTIIVIFIMFCWESVSTCSYTATEYSNFKFCNLLVFC